MSRKNLRHNVIALLTGFALLLTALGCESVTGPTLTDDGLSDSSGASFTVDKDGPQG